MAARRDDTGLAGSEVTSVVLRAHVPCGLCGYRRPLLRFASVRVNANSLREQGVTLQAGPMPCRECGWSDDRGASSLTVPSWRLDAEDTAKVDAVRARRAARRSAS